MKNILIVLIACLLHSCSTNKKEMENKNFEFYTQYGQFYITSDNGNFLNTEIKANEEAYATRLGIENNALVVFTESYGDIKGEIEVLEKPNTNVDYGKYDHIVEGGIHVKSGELKILSWPGNETELSLQIKPGIYRVRIYSSNLESVVEDDGDDFYRIELWQSNDMERKVLKQYNNAK